MVYHFLCQRMLPQYSLATSYVKLLARAFRREDYKIRDPSKASIRQKERRWSGRGKLKNTYASW